MQKRFVPYILALLIIIVYGRCLGGDFVWDDNIFLVGNHAYKYFDLYKILESCANGVEYLPIRDLTYALDYALWGENAAGFHLTNLLLFIFLSIVIFRFTFNLLNTYVENITGSFSTSAAFIITALYCVHPLQVQIVSLITCRNVLLSGIFFFLSLNFYLLFNKCSNGPIRYLLFSLLMFVLAIFSKVSVISLPLVILLLTIHIPQNRKKNIIFFIIMLLISGAAFIVFKQIAIGNRVVNQDALVYGILNNLIGLARVVQIPLFYLDKALFPTGLSPQYDIPFSVSIFSARCTLSFFVIAGITVIVAMARKNSLLLFGWIFYLIMLIPVSNFYSTFPIVADRYMFLPLFGIIIMLSSVCISYQKTGIKLSSNCIFASITLILAIYSFSQIPVYSTEEKLWKRVLQLNPKDSRALVNLGSNYLAQSRFDNAFAAFKMAQDIDPSTPNYDYSQGLVLFRKNQIQAADMKFNKALERSGEHLPSQYYAALCLLRTGYVMDAARMFRNMDESTSADIFNFRKKRDMMLGVFVEPRLRKEFEKIESELLVRPDDIEFIVKKLNILFITRNYNHAVNYYQEVNNKDSLPGNVSTLIGYSYNQTGDSLNAKRMFKSALSSPIPDIAASVPLSKILVNEKRYAEAGGILKNAADYGYEHASAEMAKLQFRMGNKNKTIDWINRTNALGNLHRIQMNALSIKVAAVND